MNYETVMISMLMTHLVIGTRSDETGITAALSFIASKSAAVYFLYCISGKSGNAEK